MALLFGAFLPLSARAELTGADLLAACERALANGFRGVQGKLCTWYVTPCDCEPETSPLPRVCLVEPIVPAKLAVEVSEVLKAIPEFQQKDAKHAAALILSELYPCAE